MNEFLMKLRLIFFILLPFVFAIWAWGWWWFIAVALIIVVLAKVNADAITAETVMGALCGVAIASLALDAALPGAASTSGFIYAGAYWLICILVA